MNKIIYLYRIVQVAMLAVLVSVLLKEIPEGKNLIEGILAVILTGIGWYILTETIIVLILEVTNIRKSLNQIENILVKNMVDSEVESAKIKKNLLN